MIPQITGNNPLTIASLKAFYDGAYGHGGKWRKPRKRLKETEDGSFKYCKEFKKDVEAGKVPNIPLEITLSECSLEAASNQDEYDSAMVTILSQWVSLLKEAENG